MKNMIRKFISFLFCVAVLPSIVIVTPANAYSYNKVEIKPNMSREECWIEAAKYTQTGLSRERIAVEIYGISRTKITGDRVTRAVNLSAIAYCIGSYAGAGFATLITEGGGAPLFATATKICATAIGTAGTVDFFVTTGESLDTSGKYYQVTLGEASEKRRNEYYKLWYKEAGSTIRSALNKKKVVDISGNSNDSGAKVQLWTDNGTSAQRFYILRTGDDNWCNIFKEGTFKCLDVTSGKAGNGVKVQLWNYNGTDAQMWKFESAGNGYVYIKNKLGYYLDVSGGNTDDGTQIQTWTLNKTKAQKWKTA